MNSGPLSVHLSEPLGDVLFDQLYDQFWDRGTDVFDSPLYDQFNFRLHGGLWGRLVSQLQQQLWEGLPC